MKFSSNKRLEEGNIVRIGLLLLAIMIILYSHFLIGKVISEIPILMGVFLLYLAYVFVSSYIR